MLLVIVKGVGSSGLHPSGGGRGRSRKTLLGLGLTPSRNGFQSRVNRQWRRVVTAVYAWEVVPVDGVSGRNREGIRTNPGPDTRVSGSPDYRGPNGVGYQYQTDTQTDRGD